MQLYVTYFSIPRRLQGWQSQWHLVSKNLEARFLKFKEKGFDDRIFLLLSLETSLLVSSSRLIIIHD